MEGVEWSRQHNVRVLEFGGGGGVGGQAGQEEGQEAGQEAGQAGERSTDSRQRAESSARQGSQPNALPRGGGGGEGEAEEVKALPGAACRRAAEVEVKLRDVQCIGAAWEELPVDLSAEPLLHPTAGTFLFFFSFFFLFSLSFRHEWQQK